jgi:hypothetical protein
VKYNKLAGHGSSRSEGRRRIFKIPDKCYIQEKAYVKEYIFNGDKTGLFYKDISKGTHILQMSFP